jgi:hypothetical protein
MKELTCFFPFFFLLTDIPMCCLEHIGEPTDGNHALRVIGQQAAKSPDPQYCGTTTRTHNIRPLL